MMDAPSHAPRAAHEDALRWLAIVNGAVGALHAEAYGRSAGPVGLAASAFVRLATFAQVFALCAVLAVLLSPLARVRSGRTTLRVLAPLGFASFQALLVLDRVVFQLFHFHLNRMVVGLVFAPGGLAALELGPWDVVVVSAALAASIVAEALLHRWRLGWAHRRSAAPGGRGRWVPVLGVALLLVLTERSAYAIADLRGSVEVTRVAAAVPAYGPISPRQLGRLLGGRRIESRAALLAQPRPGAGDVHYPLAPLKFRPDAPRRSIVWILLDGWRSDDFDPAVTPSISSLAAQATVLRRHVSGGNMTEFGLFSMFYGLHGTYHDSFEASRTPPVLITSLQERGYSVGIFSSAGLAYPKARDTVFAGVPESVFDTYPGDGVERDRAATDAALAFLRLRAQDRASFLLVLFLDASHAPYSFPRETARFTPYAESLHYVGMDADPARLRNRYRNAVHYDDGLAGEILASPLGRDRETIVVVTSDHGESFGEGGRWFHNSGFGPEQTRVPAVLRAPGLPPGARTELTRHVDLAPTVLALLGADNPPNDFSVGRSLLGGTPPEFAVACGWAACAVIEGDARATVFPNLVEGGGSLDAYDASYRPLALSGVLGPSALPAVLGEMRRFLR